jgi:putative ABC transport system permease protein
MTATPRAVDTATNAAYGRLLHAVWEGSNAAFAAVRANALRSALTALGVIIGVAAVIAVVAVMQGFSSTITKRLDDMAPDMVSLRAHTPTQLALTGLRNRLSYEDFLALRSRARGVLDMTVQMNPLSFGGSVRYGAKATTTRILGTDSSYQNVVRAYADRGRFLSESDDLRRRRVVVLGATVARELELPADPIGQFIEISGDWFRVIGVAESRGSLFGLDQDNFILVPFSTLRALAGDRTGDDIDIYFRIAGETQLEPLQAQMRHILRTRHNLTEDQPDTFEFQTSEKARKNFAEIVRGVTFAAGAVVGISLLVGGIGIMNIMLVSVTERTREIGINKSLGATPQFILIQFLVEALVLSLFGGICGLALGWGFAVVLSLSIPGMGGASVPVWAVLLSFGFTTAIGVIFGLAPAIRASRLNPIDALRHE